MGETQTPPPEPLPLQWLAPGEAVEEKEQVTEEAEGSLNTGMKAV